MQNYRTDANVTWKSDFPCISCGMNIQNCFHHVYTRKAYPEFQNENWNLMSLCSMCHNSIHRYGTSEFAKRNENVYRWLVDNGWEKCQLTGKWKHYEK